MSDEMEQRMGLEREIPQLSLAYVADQSSRERAENGLTDQFFCNNSVKQYAVQFSSTGLGSQS